MSYLSHGIIFNSTTKSPYEPLNQIFIDDTVTDILEEYFLPEYEMSREAKYDFLEKNHQLDNIFTPRDNGNYSYQAYQFGYPKNNYDEALKSSDNDE